MWAQLKLKPKASRKKKKNPVPYTQEIIFESLKKWKGCELMLVTVFSFYKLVAVDWILFVLLESHNGFIFF